MDGPEKFSCVVIRKCLLNLYCKLFSLMRCHVFEFLHLFVRNWRCVVRIFGGDQMKVIIKCGGSMLHHGVAWYNPIKYIGQTSLCKPKNLGGMVFQSLRAFNKLLLAKQVWCIIQEPSTLFPRILKACYFKHVDVMEERFGSNPSYFLRLFLWSRELLQRRLFQKVGNGQSVRALTDIWIPGLASRKIYISYHMDRGFQVANFLLPSRRWNEPLLRSFFFLVSHEVETCWVRYNTGMDAEEI